MEARLSEAKVPAVKLLQSLQLSPHLSAVVLVHIDGCGDRISLQGMLQHSEEGCTRMVISNRSLYPQVAESGTTIGEVIARCSGGSGCITRAQ